MIIINTMHNRTHEHIINDLICNNYGVTTTVVDCGLNSKTTKRYFGVGTTGWTLLMDFAHEQAISYQQHGNMDMDLVGLTNGTPLLGLR